MVVDYRAVNRVTVRKRFMIPDANQIKASVAGSAYLSVGDLKEGFNQVDNEPDTKKKLAVMIASGTYLPRDLRSGLRMGLKISRNWSLSCLLDACTRNGFFFLTIYPCPRARKDLLLLARLTLMTC